MYNKSMMQVQSCCPRRWISVPTPSCSQPFLVSSAQRSSSSSVAGETSKFKASRIRDNRKNFTTLESEIRKCERLKIAH